MRIRSVEEVDTAEERDYYDVLSLYNIGREYKINLKTGKCNVTALTQPFLEVGVPKGAEFTGEATIGLPGVEGEYVFVENVSGDRGDGKYFGSVTTPNCYPIEDHFSSPETLLVSNSYFDITIGITDPNVFIPPQEYTNC